MRRVTPSREGSADDTAGPRRLWICKAWFHGRLYKDVDGAMAFFNAVCDSDPSRCTGKIVERPRSVWWVQIRNAQGHVGWSDEPVKFDGKDALGG